MKKLRFDLLTESQWKLFLDRLMSWRDKKVRLSVTVQRYAKKRSTDANRYYWGVVVNTLAEATGYTPAEMHRLLLMEYFGSEKKEFHGKVYEFPRRSTTKPDMCDTMEFMCLIQHGQKTAAELGIVLPDEDAPHEA